MSTTWRIFTDGGSRGNPGPAAMGVHVIDGGGNVVFQLSTFLGQTTNNEAEYQAVLASVKWLKQALTTQPINRVEWYLDSLLVVEQLNKRWKIKEARLRVFAHQIWQLLQTLPVPYSFSHVRRELNCEADALVNQALDAAAA